MNENVNVDKEIKSENDEKVSSRGEVRSMRSMRRRMKRRRE